MREIDRCLSGRAWRNPQNLSVEITVFFAEIWRHDGSNSKQDRCCLVVRKRWCKSEGHLVICHRRYRGLLCVLLYSCSTFAPHGVGGQRTFRPHYSWQASVSFIQEATWAPGRIGAENWSGIFMKWDIVTIKLWIVYLNISFPIVTSWNKYCGFTT